MRPQGPRSTPILDDELERLRYLVSLTSSLLGGTLSVPETLARLVRLLVPDVAPDCVAEVSLPGHATIARAVATADGGVVTSIEHHAVDALRPSSAPVDDEATTLEIPLSLRGSTFGRIVFNGLDAARIARLGQLGVEIGRRASVAVGDALLFLSEQTARLEAEERARRIAIINVVTRELSRSVTVSEIADVFVDKATFAAGAVSGTLYLLDETRTSLELVRQVGYDASVIDAWGRFAVSSASALGEAVVTAAPVWLGSREDFEERFSGYAELVDRTGNRAWGAVPLVADGRAFGVVGLSFAEPRLFDVEDREFIGGLVDQCAHAIERARLYERATEANRAKDRFLAVLSHELRTPLTPVLPAVQAIEEDGISDTARAMTEIIRRNVQLELRLIDDLLDVARIVNGKLALRRERVDMHATIRNVAAICAADVEAKSIALLLDFQAIDHQVDGDASRLQQALWNLVKNAVKFTGDGGVVTVRTTSDGERLRIAVIDDGVGIDPVLLARIFDPFMQGSEAQQARYGGLGLGLAISRSVVDLHGGTLEALSPGLGRGSQFAITLALDRVGRPVEEAPAPARRSGTRTGACRVLLVDDHDDTVFVLRRMLERSGFRVTTAASCTAARQLAVLGEFDVLVSDIGLPDGSGYELLADILLHNPVPAIAISGFGSAEDVARSRAVGFRSHLTKPVEHRALVEAIRDVIG